MKFDVPEGVATQAVQALAESSDPNVKALARIVSATLRRPAPARLTADELHAVCLALNEWIVSADAKHLEVQENGDTNMMLVSHAVEKLAVLHRMQLAREARS